ncbi:phage holin family protein [Serratia sp. NPDC078756]
MVSEILLIVNALVCALSALRLMTFRRAGGAHRPLAAWCAYLLIIASASVPIRVLAGEYVSADWSETLINIAFCVTVWAARGNVMQLAKPFLR